MTSHGQAMKAVTEVLSVSMSPIWPRENASQTEWMAVGDGVYYRMQHHQGDGDLGDVASVEDRAESLPPEAESIVDDVRREKLVTQLARGS